MFVSGFETPSPGDRLCRVPLKNPLRKKQKIPKGRSHFVVVFSHLPPHAVVVEVHVRSDVLPAFVGVHESAARKRVKIVRVIWDSLPVFHLCNSTPCWLLWRHAEKTNHHNRLFGPKKAQNVKRFWEGMGWLIHEPDMRIDQWIVIPNPFFRTLKF